jgi:hypothetical protein
MSCSIDKILDASTNKSIDEGVERISKKISDTVKNEDSNIECNNSKIDHWISIINMGIQYLILSFVILALLNHEKSALIITVITWTAYVSLALLMVRYRNVLISAGRILLYGLDLETQIILAFSIFITLITGFIKKGTAGMKLTLTIAFLIFIRLALQMKDFLLDKKSNLSAFMEFVKELLTPTRISKIYKSF